MSAYFQVMGHFKDDTNDKRNLTVLSLTIFALWTGLRTDSSNEPRKSESSAQQLDTANVIKIGNFLILGKWVIMWKVGLG
ncbi:MAG: hypothetical protein U5K79_24720 [Cyclobacteriaceae bacterium]|nr:hypothetical protein [Cyclobacteriaceae bacterium]